MMIQTHVLVNFCGYGETELSIVDLEPQKQSLLQLNLILSMMMKMHYRVGIVPNRHGMDGTQEIAFICIKNCS